MKDENRHFYRFKSFRLDIEERRLLNHNSTVSLTPKAFDVLAVLVERSGQLVEKDELMRIVWADSFVEEANIARIIHTLRKSLGEDGKGDKYIETITKKGYRFVAQVAEEFEAPAPEQKKLTAHASNAVEKTPALSFGPTTANSGAAVPRSAPEVTAPLPISAVKPKMRIILFALGFLSAVFLLLLLSFNFQSNSPADSKKAKSIAVFPFKPINAANHDDIYEIGIADSLIHRLSSTRGFVVRPLSATRKYADIEQDPLAAGREQQVDYVLVSNYQLAGGKIRVTAQLLKVSNGQIEETYKTEKDAADIFAMQDAVAGEIGNMLLLRFNANSIKPAAKRGTTNEEAYRLYLQGRYLVDKRSLGDAQKSVEILEQALRLDPDYAQAWAIKAYAHNTKYFQGRDVNSHEEYKKSIEAIDKALALDKNLADAHSALCENNMYYEYNFDEAERSCKRAIELDFNSTLAHQTYARFLMGRGRFDEAITEAETAVDIDPASLFNQRVHGVSLYFARRYDEAVPHFKRILEMDPNNAAVYPWLIGALEMQGAQADIFEAQTKLLTLQKTDEETMRIFRSAFQTLGWQGVLREQAKRFEQSNHAYFFGACLNARIGNRDKAFEFLEKAYERREWAMSYLQVEPRLDPLRGDPRFDKLVRRTGLK